MRNIRTYQQSDRDHIWDLHFQQHRSYGEIAQTYGVTRCAISGVIHREKLKKRKQCLA